MNIAIPQDAIPEDKEQELSFRTAPRWTETIEPDADAPRYEVLAADDDLDDFDEDDFDDEFDDDFEEELEDEYELSEFEDVTEDDLVEGDDDLATIGGDFVDEDAEPEEPPAADDAEPAEGKAGKEGKGAKESKKKGKPAKSDEEDLDDED